MNGTNLYNCTIPGNLFVGQERLRRNFLNGFLNGNSFAVIGGRRIGKTSLLKQLEKDVIDSGLKPFTPLPQYVDIQGLDKPTPALLFEKIYNKVIKDTDAPKWSNAHNDRPYESFLSHLENAQQELNKKYGHDWFVVLFIDELDAAISKLDDDQFFQNLRNLLMVSDFSRHFRIVATGVKDMARLISSGSSPINNLRHKYLGILTGKAARTLIAYGFPRGFEPEEEVYLFQLTGKHPYILQGILEKLWDMAQEGDDIDKKAIKRTAREFLKEHSDFDRWMNTFSPAEHEVYRILSALQDGKLSVEEIHLKMDSSFTPFLDDALTVLSYHGVIDYSDMDEPEIAGTLFRNWYRDNSPVPLEKIKDMQLVFEELKTILLAADIKDEKKKEEAQKALDKGVEELKKPASGKEPDKKTLRESIEQASGVIKAAGTAADVTKTFIEKVKDLAPYLGFFGSFFL